MNQPILTIVIPVYNGSSFIDVSMHSIFNQDVIDEKIAENFEIIVIDDGSKDNSYAKALAIAHDFNVRSKRDFVRVITKTNGQYGSVVNAGLKMARGKYFKVLDVDDTFSTEGLIDLINIIISIEANVDVIFCNHTLEKVGTNKRIEKTLRHNFEPYQIFTIEDAHFPRDLITMHGIIYRTSFLRQINYEQAERVYYSDSQYAISPLLQAKNFFYIDLVLYRYYIGRAEQSINLQTMVKNRLHQRQVFERVLVGVNFNSPASANVMRYITVALRRLAQWQAMLIAVDPSIKNKRAVMKEFLADIKRLQPDHYKKVLNDILFHTIRITDGHFILPLIKIGIKIYAKFKTNILAEWD